MSRPVKIIQKVVSPFAGMINRGRLGFPRYFFQGAGGIGDDLMCTAVFRELKKRGNRGIAFVTPNPGLFERNQDIDELIPVRNTKADQWAQLGLPFTRLAYSSYDPIRDAEEIPNEHVLIKMCRLAGIGGPIELSPNHYLTPEEFAAGKIADGQVVMQSSGMSATYAMRNKEWFPYRFQEVCSELRADVHVIQLGSPNDPKLEGATDLRGKTTLRQSAAIMANSYVLRRPGSAGSRT